MHFVSDLKAELKLDLNPPLVVDGSGTTDLTLFADLGTWFRDAGGNLLDPSSVSGQLVADNIARAFHAFEDKNQDGSDDHGGDDKGSGALTTTAAAVTALTMARPRSDPHRGRQGDARPPVAGRSRDHLGQLPGSRA